VRFWFTRCTLYFLTPLLESSHHFTALLDDKSLSLSESVSFVGIKTEGTTNKETVITLVDLHTVQTLTDWTNSKCINGKKSRKVNYCTTICDGEMPGARCGARRDELQHVFTVRENFEGSSRRSARQQSRILGISKRSLGWIFQSIIFHPYKMQIIQQLFLGDKVCRVEFCNTSHDQRVRRTSRSQTSCGDFLKNVHTGIVHTQQRSWNVQFKPKLLSIKIRICCAVCLIILWIV
jgi:hypothetical protein